MVVSPSGVIGQSVQSRVALVQYNEHENVAILNQPTMVVIVLG
jgi:hypothetical protein